MITVIYRVSVEMSDVVTDYLSVNMGNKDFENDIYFATKKAIASGANHYDEEQWAEFHNKKDAEECQKMLMDINYKYTAKWSKHYEN